MRNLANCFLVAAKKKGFSKACISGLTFYSCITQFMESRTTVRDKPKPGGPLSWGWGEGVGERPAKAVTPIMVANVEVSVNKDRRVTLQEVVNQFSISRVSVHPI